MNYYNVLLFNARNIVGFDVYMSDKICVSLYCYWFSLFIAILNIATAVEHYQTWLSDSEYFGYNAPDGWERCVCEHYIFSLTRDGRRVGR